MFVLNVVREWFNSTRLIPIVADGMTFCFCPIGAKVESHG